MSYPSIRDDLANLIRCGIIDFPELMPMESDHDLIVHNNVTIKNKMWKSRGLRRIHLETAETDKIEICHCVFWPDPTFPLPIFGADIIQTPAGVTAAIVDISFVDGVDWTKDIAPIAELYNFKDPRPLPLWGDIFSPFCKFARLKTEEEQTKFYQVVFEYLRLYSKKLKKIKQDPEDEWVGTMKRISDQCWYSTAQKKNKKTKAVLSQWFSEEWADKYIENILFDKP